MSEAEPVTLADVYELIAKEHAVTSTKLESLRAEGRMRETDLMTAINRVESNMRKYVDSETDVLQISLNTMHANIFGNGDMEHALAYRLQATEDALDRWTRSVNRILLPIGITLTTTLAIATVSFLWGLLTGKLELIVH